MTTREDEFKLRYFLLFVLLFAALTRCNKSDFGNAGAELLLLQQLNPEEQLGKLIFFDENLSEPVGQACASCHSPEAGFATPAAGMINGITPGIHTDRSGARNTPTAAYMAFSPDRYFDQEIKAWVGGQFLDQRAASLEEQAGGPFLNFVEMANSGKEQVIGKIAASSYASLFRYVYGNDIFNETEFAYQAMTQAIASFERSSEVSPFNSRFDRYLAGTGSLTIQELRGFTLFRGKANCEACHPASGDSPLFTDFSSDNLGVPKNPLNPFYSMPADINPDGAAFVDRGLGASPLVNNPAYNGRFKVPTLRNIGKTAPYFHNGSFNSLTEVVRFYNTACVPGNPDNWPEPEVAAGRNCTELGNLQLTEEEMDDIVAFLKTLDDI